LANALILVSFYAMPVLVRRVDIWVLSFRAFAERRLLLGDVLIQITMPVGVVNRSVETFYYAESMTAKGSVMKGCVVVARYWLIRNASVARKKSLYLASNERMKRRATQKTSHGLAVSTAERNATGSMTVASRLTSVKVLAMFRRSFQPTAHIRQMLSAIALVAKRL
jgi:hypothetical protein